MTSTQDTKEQAQQTATTAADEGRHVAGVVGDEVQNVAGQAKDQALGLVDDALGQIDEQSRAQRDRLVGTLQSVSTDLEAMASSVDSGLATQLAQQVAERARSLSTHLDGREPSELLQDVRRFARRRPGLFLLGALGAGVVAGRMARGAKQAHSSGTGPATTTPAALTDTPTPDPLATPSTSAPSYGQPAVAIPASPVAPTFADDGGLGSQPSPVRSAHPNHDNGSGSGPQGDLP
jgi:hypothetical protein